MNKILSTLSAILLSVLLSFSAMNAEAGECAQVRAFFSPGSECATALINEVDHACDTVQVLIYQLTDRDIANAFIRAYQRGVRVTVVVDKSMRKSRDSQVVFLLDAGVPVLVDERHAIMHNKVIIIDGQTVITGSYNFSNSARKRNAENLIILSDEELAGQYSENFSMHLSHSVLP